MGKEDNYNEVVSGGNSPGIFIVYKKRIYRDY